MQPVSSYSGAVVTAIEGPAFFLITDGDANALYFWCFVVDVRDRIVICFVHRRQILSSYYEGIVFVFNET